jgi:predicted membrane protein
VVGAFLIFRPRNRGNWTGGEEEKKNSGDTVFVETVMSSKTRDHKEDFVDSTSIFGGAKKNIISKNFQGGDLVNIFGGTELDLTRADFNGTATIELTTIFGGTKLIVPSNWTIKSDAVTLFGGMEDKRNVQNLPENSPEKTLLLRGTVIFGGIEIKSF